jgi:recombination associated protein RdgC
MLLESGEGMPAKEVICRGLQTELRKQGRAGAGQKPEQARLRLAHGDYEFGVTLTAAVFEFRNIRLPKTVDSSDEGKNAESLEGRVLERIALFEQLTHLVSHLFRLFINIRASHLWNEELIKIRAWIESGAHQG